MSGACAIQRLRRGGLHARRWVAGLLVAAAAVLGPALPAGAAPLPIETPEGALFEEVLRIPAAGPLAAELEVTVFRPRVGGPFPVAVINHGRSPGPAHMQTRYRPLHVAYELVRRGWAVVVPMRQGFSRSGGVEIDGSCDIAANGRQQARSVRRAVDWAAEQPWAEPMRNVVIGQSHGGLATLAYGENPHPGTHLLVNFAGGLKQPGCPAWEDTLVDALAGYGAQTAVPSLWFYGDNDSYFKPSVWRTAFARYVAAGGPATLQAYGHFSTDAHLLFGARDGLPTWLPSVLGAFAQAGLPTRIESRYEPIPDLPEPLPLRAASAGEAERLRVASARQGFLTWLRVTVPKAFAISDNGLHWASAWGVARPIAQALEHCERLAGTRCRLFAVNGFVVGTGESGTD